jgi:hypothetical protein
LLGADGAALAQLNAAVGRLPPGEALRARISIGPMPSADPVTGLARAQHYAEVVADALPERLRPASLEYRPDLAPGTLLVEFAPAMAAVNG